MAIVDLEICVYLHITHKGKNDNFLKKNSSCCILGGWVGEGGGGWLIFDM